MKQPDEHIIEKVLANKGTTAQSNEVTQWLLTLEGMDYLVQRMNREEATDTLPMLPMTDIPSQPMKDRLVGVIAHRRIRQFTLKAAAVLIPLAFALSTLMYVNTRVPLFSKGELTEVSVPAGEQLTFVFQDGSRARLNAGSTIRFPAQFGLSSRRVKLDGEAFFEVAPNRNRPFIVETPHLNVEVKGTSFNINAYPTSPNVVVKLYTGAVEIHTLRLKSLLQPYDIATYNISSGRISIKKCQENEKTPGWISRRFVFSNTPLKEVLETLSRAYDVHFEVSDPNIYALEYTLIQQQSTLETILSDLERISNVKITYLNDRIKVDHKQTR